MCVVAVVQRLGGMKGWVGKESILKIFFCLLFTNLIKKRHDIVLLVIRLLFYILQTY